MLITDMPVLRIATAGALAAVLTGCAAVGSMMSPYPEKFACKNDDHGQCIHPERAYEDAVAGARSGSDPAVTRAGKVSGGARANREVRRGADAFGSYKDSVYRELKGLIDAPVTPMLKPARAVRTLILPYADRQRPDRLYMPRYIYSVLERPLWVVGDLLVSAPNRASSAPVLGQVSEAISSAPDLPDAPAGSER